MTARMVSVNTFFVLIENWEPDEIFLSDLSSGPNCLSMNFSHYRNRDLDNPIKNLQE